MKKRTLVAGAVVVLVAAGAIVVATRGGLWSPSAVAQATRQNAPRAVPVEVVTAIKKVVPVRLEVLGSVTPIASVVVKSRVDSEITGVHFRDGALVREGDLLFTLDSRTLEAQVRQVHNARTQTNIYRASVDSNTAQLENLNVQLSYCNIQAPITGRASMVPFKVGNFVRAGDATLATIIQTAPVYVTFSLPQGFLPDLRQALANESATIEAIIPGEPRRANGQVTMIENSVDAPTGTVPVRATMPNTDELLWPGTLVTVQLTFREETAVAVPSTAIQPSQTGSYVFVVKGEVAIVQPVEVARVLGSESVLARGLEGGETVVVNGQLLLSNGTKVAIRAPKVGS